MYKMEKKGSSAVNNYLKKLTLEVAQKNGESDNLFEISKHTVFAFIPSDVIEKLKQDNPEKMNKLSKIILSDFAIYIPEVILDKQDLNKLVEKIYLSYQLANQITKNLVNEENTRTKNVFLLMSDAKKIFPKHREIFTVRSTNSAEYNGIFNKLNILRSEELFKLMLHEFFHLSGLDFKIENDSNGRFNKVWNVYKIGSGLLLNESIVEALASVVNIVITNIICQNNDIRYYFDNEIKFGLLQTAKILYISGFDSVIQLIDPKYRKKVIETTSTVEYHIFKTIILMNFNKFIKLLRENKIEEIENMIYDFVKNSKYFRFYVDSIINKLKIGHNDKDDILFNTGRMTITEYY